MSRKMSKKQIEICNRVLSVANYMIANNATVRECVKEFRYSKATIHLDITKRLKSINPEYYEKAMAIINNNKSERHLRGGNATKSKYKKGDDRCDKYIWCENG